MIGFSIVIVDEWIVKNQASYLGPGVLSYLQYGRTLMKVPIGVFGMAAGVAAYPTISRLVAARRHPGSLQPAAPRRAADAGSDLRRAGLPDGRRFRGGLSDLGPVREPLHNRRRRGDRRGSGFPEPGPERLGGADRDRPGLLCARQHLAADGARHRHRGAFAAALCRVPPALGGHRARRRQRDRHPRLCLLPWGCCSAGASSARRPRAAAP